MGGEDIGASELPALARRRGLQKVAALLEVPQVRSRLGRMALPDEDLLGRPSRDPSVKLREMVRRGIDPGAVARLSYSTRLEVGLLAWDVLSGSLLAIDDDAWTKQLRAEASAIKVVLPPSTSRAVDVGWCLEARNAVGVHPGRETPLSELSESLQRGEVSAALELLARGRSEADIVSANRGRLIDQGRILRRAHLTTMASATFAVVASALHDATAQQELIETQLDSAAFDRLSAVETLDAELRPYVSYRCAVARQDSATAMRAYREATDGSPRSRLVRADIEALRKPDVALESIRDIVDSSDDWRWAAEVRIRIFLAARKPIAQPLEDYLRRFGNDESIWLSIASRSDSLPEAEELRARALREAYALPHDPAAWSALGQILGEPFAQTIDTEVAARQLAQASFDP